MRCRGNNSRKRFETISWDVELLPIWNVAEEIIRASGLKLNAVVKPSGQLLVAEEIIRASGLKLISAFCDAVEVRELQRK